MNIKNSDSRFIRSSLDRTSGTFPETAACAEPALNCGPPEPEECEISRANAFCTATRQYKLAHESAAVTASIPAKTFNLVAPGKGLTGLAISAGHCSA